jgi:Ca2+-transporting ATPase
MGLRIVLTGAWMAAVCLAAQFLLAHQGQNEITQRSFVFTLLCFGQLINAVVVRSNQIILSRSGEYRNWRLWYAIAFIVALQFVLLFVPLAQGIFKTTALTWSLGAWLAGGLILMLFGFEAIRFKTKQHQ